MMMMMIIREKSNETWTVDRSLCWSDHRDWAACGVARPQEWKQENPGKLIFSIEIIKKDGSKKILENWKFKSSRRIKAKNPGKFKILKFKSLGSIKAKKNLKIQKKLNWHPEEWWKAENPAKSSIWLNLHHRHFFASASQFGISILIPTSSFCFASVKQWMSSRLSSTNPT